MIPGSRPVDQQASCGPTGGEAVRGTGRPRGFVPRASGTQGQNGPVRCEPVPSDACAAIRERMATSAPLTVAVWL